MINHGSFIAGRTVIPMDTYQKGSPVLVSSFQPSEQIPSMPSPSPVGRGIFGDVLIAFPGHSYPKTFRF
ncbi:hypothetical protein EFBL_2534 [Effusibacillus lacus]|uniref:Uncharacterized protein n=1 Tax=Effusibacillus lacus TaxID=1348429 RepID=A0A292YE11_9BACL|nr:hypothetical protein EFBL_2534 [Effusibacillus lacus]